MTRRWSGSKVVVVINVEFRGSLPGPAILKSVVDQEKMALKIARAGGRRRRPSLFKPTIYLKFGMDSHGSSHVHACYRHGGCAAGLETAASRYVIGPEVFPRLTSSAKRTCVGTDLQNWDGILISGASQELDDELPNLPSSNTPLGCKPSLKLQQKLKFIMLSVPGTRPRGLQLQDTLRLGNLAGQDCFFTRTVSRAYTRISSLIIWKHGRHAARGLGGPAAGSRRGNRHTSSRAASEPNTS